MDPRTVGWVFTAADGKQYRPSLFGSLTRPSYGAVLVNGGPKKPAHYDYRRAALDALHFAKLCSRFWTHLRRCAGYNVQDSSVIEAQKHGAPHLHAAVRARSRGRSSARSSPPPTSPYGGRPSTGRL